MSVPFVQVIESEYTAKYLESLGASPSQAAQDLVRKALPLTADCLQTKLKVRNTRAFGRAPCFSLHAAMHVQVTTSYVWQSCRRQVTGTMK